MAERLDCNTGSGLQINCVNIVQTAADQLILPLCIIKPTLGSCNKSESVRHCLQQAERSVCDIKVQGLAENS